jgi:hypothetical protein
MTRIEFTHSYNGRDMWVFQMDPAVALNGTCGYRVRYDSGKQWTECLLRKAPRGSSPDEIQQLIIDWEGRILRPLSGIGTAA